MPKKKRFVVYVDRKVTQWTEVVVEAESKEQILKARRKVFNTACVQSTDWTCNDDGDDGLYRTRVMVEIPPEQYAEYSEPVTEITEQDEEVECADCGTTLRRDQMPHQYPDIPDLLERMTPGEEVPVGECPKCFSLVHCTK